MTIYHTGKAWLIHMVWILIGLAVVLGAARLGWRGLAGLLFDLWPAAAFFSIWEAYPLAVVRIFGVESRINRNGPLLVVVTGVIYVVLIVALGLAF